MTLKQDSVTNFTEIPMRYYFTGIKLPDQLSSEISYFTLTQSIEPGISLKILK